MLVESITRNAQPLGRAFNHIEDLVMFYGSSGALQSLSVLQDIVKNPQQIRWKWDGKPTVYWGREPDGTFVMTGSGGWRKKDGSGKTTNLRQLAQYIMNTGNDETIQRQKFATSFASLWPLFEAATPENFRGYVYGDLLYMTKPQVEKNQFVFTPNQVTYSVDVKSQLGKRINMSSAAVIGHAFYPSFGMEDRQQKPLKDFSIFNQTPGLIVLGPRYAETRVKINTNQIKQLLTYVKSQAKHIDALLNDQALAVNRMVGFKNVLYKFNNQQVRAGSLSGLAGKFINWLAGSGESQAQQSKIEKWVTEHSTGFAALFYILETIRAIKDQVIQQLDQEHGDIHQSMNGQLGGEGYVVYNPQGNIKLVARNRWTPPR